MDNKNRRLKMQSKLSLNITDFGPIKESDIVINQINVVAGQNGSGKSFSSKLLFCFLTSMSNKGRLIENNGIYGSFAMFIKRWVDNISITSSEQITYDYAELKDKLSSLMLKWDESEISYEYLDAFYSKFKEVIEEYGLLDNENCKSDINSIKENIDINKKNHAYLGRVINFLLLGEFGPSSLKSLTGGKINFKDTNEELFDFRMEFENDAVNLNLNVNDIDELNINKVIYIDNIQVLGFKIRNTQNGIVINNNSSPYHSISLIENLIQEQSYNSVALEEIYVKYKKKFETELFDMIGGLFEFDPEQNEFTFRTNGDIYDVRNIASGYKQMGLIQLLLSNKSISEGTWLIIDEPEVNLHPGLQIKLVKLLVDMAKELNVKIYLNSHSPFIIEAMEVYSKKEKMDDNVSFFLTKPMDENKKKFNISEIDMVNLKEIYENLADPYHILNSVRFETDWEDEFE